MHRSSDLKGTKETAIQTEREWEICLENGLRFLAFSFLAGNWLKRKSAAGNLAIIK